MLPNWLYGKSKSKLASILGGGGGTPADYNQVKAQVNQNTEDIGLLSDALDDKAALTQITNPNLFDNPWFTINQRGLSNYVQASYSADRWRVNADNTPTIEFTNNGIEISNYETGNIVFYQRYESNFLNSSKDYTLSIMASDGTILSSALKKDGSLFYMGQLAGANFYHKIAEVSGNIFEVDIVVNTMTSNLTIRAVKLELGSVSTLAMDTAPNYATELLKCQRYFYKTLQFDDNGANISPNQCLAVSTTRLQGIKFPAEMRANPTITVNKVNELGSSTAITGVISQWTSKEGISYFTIADATVGNLYIVDFEASADL